MKTTEIKMTNGRFRKTEIHKMEPIETTGIKEVQ